MSEITIEVEGGDAESMQRALDDPEVQAFVCIVGLLLPLTDRGRKRVLRFIADQCDEEREGSDG